MNDPRMAAKVLRRAAEIVEQGFCQGHLAVNTEGRYVDELSPTATAWCALGAMCLAAHQVTGSRSNDLGAWSALNALVQPTLIHEWNNAPERTADEVAQALRDAAERCEAGA